MKTKHLVPLFLISVVLAANTRYSPPLPHPPPKGDEVVAFGNSPEGFAERVYLEKSQLCQFLDNGVVYQDSMPGELRDPMPQELSDRLNATKLGLTRTKDGLEVMTITTCDGAFSDKQGRLFFWMVPAPEFLTVTDEQGRSCIIFLSPSPLSPNHSPQPTPGSSAAERG